MTNPNFTPILLGSDFNVYGMARSFHEAYNIKSTAFSAGHLAATRYSSIVTVQAFDGFDEDPVFIETMRQKMKEYADHTEPVILIACGDGYAELLSKHKEELKGVFVVPYIDYDLLNHLIRKEEFYQIAAEHKLDRKSTRLNSSH